MQQSKRRIVIAGGGFAGAETARSLRGRLPAGYELVVLSRDNHFVFTPLLPEVVGAAINPLHVVWPVREMARGVACRTVTVTRIDFEAREVHCHAQGGRPLVEPYDQLVLAFGLAVNMNLVPGMAEHGWPLKTLGDSIALRNHLVQQLELAEAEPDAGRRARLLSFAVVGGGFTGVEVAGSINDLLREASRFYGRFGEDDVRVTIVDGGERILGPLPEHLSAYAARQLRGRGVDVRNGVSVERVAAEGVRVVGGELVAAGTTISAVGNTVQSVLEDAGLPMQRGRIRVDGAMRVEGREGVWALGDCAAVPNAYDGRVSPTLGQFALRQARQLARNLELDARGEPPQLFSYHSQGMFAAIGHRKAVGQAFGVQISGFPGYVLWRGVYLGKLPSFGRKVQVAFDWLWDLFWRRDIVEITTERTPRDG